MSAAARLFVAVALDEEVRAALSETVGELRASGADARWTRRDSLHVTLKFLGGVLPERFAALEDALRPAVAAFAARAVAVRGLGVFPDPRHPRIVWAGVGGDFLATLAAAVDEAFAPLGFAAEARAFHAHVTLGRLRSRRGWRALRTRLEERAARSFGSSLVKSVDIFCSDLRRDGAVYTRLVRAPLASLADEGGTDGS